MQLVAGAIARGAMYHFTTALGPAYAHPFHFVAEDSFGRGTGLRRSRFVVQKGNFAKKVSGIQKAKGLRVFDYLIDSVLSIVFVYRNLIVSWQFPGTRRPDHERLILFKLAN